MFIAVSHSIFGHDELVHFSGSVQFAFSVMFFVLPRDSTCFLLLNPLAGVMEFHQLSDEMTFNAFYAYIFMF